MISTTTKMGMPCSINLVESHHSPQKMQATVDAVWSYYDWVDATFSPFKSDSEVSRINHGELLPEQASPEVQHVLRLCEVTRAQTNGYFNISHDGKIDPCGLVKGWAIQEAAELLRQHGFENFLIEIAGDMQAIGRSEQGQPWRVGIRNPFDLQEIIKVLVVENKGVATSGTYLQGAHIYDPVREPPQNSHPVAPEIVSLTVVGPNIYEADRFATAAFAMGHHGISFIEGLDGFDGYCVDADHQATYTSGFAKYVE